MAGLTKAPFYGAAYYEKRGIVKGAVLMSRAYTQPRVEYVSGLLHDLVTGIAKGMIRAGLETFNLVHEHNLVTRKTLLRRSEFGEKKLRYDYDRGWWRPLP